MKTQISPIEQMINSQLDENTSVIEALELIMGERAGESFTIYDYKLLDTQYGDFYESNWLQQIAIIGSRDLGWSDIEMDAKIWTVTNVEVEVDSYIKTENLADYFNEAAIARFNNKGKILISNSIVSKMEFSEEEIRKYSKHAYEEGYNSQSDYADDEYLLEEDADDDIISEIGDCIMDLVKEDWVTLTEEEKSDYEYEDGEDTNEAPNSYFESQTEGVWFNKAAQEMIIEHYKMITA